MKRNGGADNAPLQSRPHENDPRVAELRDLQTAVARAVLDAYGWSDVSTGCGFFLDYEIDEALWGRKKNSHRYPWPDPTRDEVLARLFALDADRTAEEARTAAADRRPEPAPADGGAKPTAGDPAPRSCLGTAPLSRYGLA